MHIFVYLRLSPTLKYAHLVALIRQGQSLRRGPAEFVRGRIICARI